MFITFNDLMQLFIMLIAFASLLLIIYKEINKK